MYLPDDNLELVERLGAGGLGSVWLTRDHDSQYPTLTSDGQVCSVVAIKFLLNLPNHDGNDSWKHFIQEAAVGIGLRSLSVAKVVPSFKLISLRSNPAWHPARAAIVMQCIEPSLDRVLEQLDEPLPAAVGIDFAIHLATALRDLHARGLVHRDIKPGNVLIQLARGRSFADPTPDSLTGAIALLADFGFIAKERKEATFYLG